MTSPIDPERPGVEPGEDSVESARGSLLPGDRIRVEAEAADWVATASVLLSGRDRAEIELDPGGVDAAESLRVGAVVRLVVGRADGAWVQRALVVARPTAERLILDLEPGRRVRMQRREYFRLGVRLPIAVRLGRAGEPPDDATPDSAPPARESELPRLFRVLDLSGGGCFVRDDDEVLRIGAEHDACLDLRDQESPLQVRVVVVRRGRVSGEAGAGLRFLDLRESCRARIMRALFEQFRRERIRLGVGSTEETL